MIRRGNDFVGLSGTINNYYGQDPVILPGGRVSYGGDMGGLDDLFNYDEPQMDFAPIRDLMLQLNQTNVKLAQEQMDWARSRVADQDAFTRNIANQILQNATDANNRAADERGFWTENYKPLEQSMAQQAAYGITDAAQEEAAGRARADAAIAFKNARESGIREATAMGLNPNSGRFAAIQARGGLTEAAGTAGGMTLARQRQKALGLDNLSKTVAFGTGHLDRARQDDVLEQSALTGAGNVTLQNNQAASGLIGQAGQFQQAAVNSTGQLANTALNIYGMGLQGRQLAAQGLGYGGTRSGGGGGGAMAQQGLSGFSNFWNTGPSAADQIRANTAAIPLPWAGGGGLSAWN